MNTKLTIATEVAKRIIKPRISKVTIPITYDCNQRCRTCGIWSTNLKTPELKANEITEKEFIEFVTSNNLLWIAFTGGEPFSRTDINRILSWSLNYCRMVSITTNGFSPEKILRDVRGALASRKDSNLALNVSMNGSEKVHDMISGIPGSFSNAKKTLKALSDLRNPRLNIGVSYTSSSYNKGEFNTYLKEMEEIGIGIENITFGMGQDSPSYYQGKKQAELVAPGQDYVREFSENIFKNLKVGSDPLKWVSMKYLEGFTRGFQNGNSPKCVAGQYSLMLDPYWNVYPCMFFCPSDPIGNLREVNFRLNELDLSKCKSLVDNCKGCWTPCESYSTIIFRPWRCV
jgi:MoaA/NifB/PqqE/SkfB family radical SAM enzyme